MYSTYSAYKNSGAEWLGVVPADWEVKQLRHLIDGISNGTTEPQVDYKENSTVPVTRIETISDGVINWNKLGWIVPSRSSAKYVLQRGDILFSHINSIPMVGNCAIYESDTPLYVGMNLLRLRPKVNICFSWLLYFLKSQPLRGLLSSLAKPAINQASLPTQTIKSILVPVPSFPEQTRIAAFLDEKTAEIDDAIAKKQRLIELLQEQKAILINRAVTQGLDPNVSMRDSGVAWIGQVPAHWGVKRLKYILAEVNSRTTTGEETLLSLRMYDGLVPHDEVSDKPISDADLVDYKHVQLGQLVMNRMRAAIGLFAIANRSGLVSPDYAIFDIIGDINPDYYLHLFKTTLMGSVFRLESKGLGTGSSGFMRLYTDRFGAIPVPVPPKDEQAAIVSLIETAMQEYRLAQSKIEEEISLLKEFRSILISDAVTGKIKV